jgi:chaperonin GroES
MKTIRPLGNRVLIRRSKVQTTKGGILLPDTAQEKPKEGEVIAVGPGALTDKGNRELLSVKVGDRVLFSSYAGTEVKGVQGTDNEELLIMEESDIVGILG